MSIIARIETVVRSVFSFVFSSASPVLPQAPSSPAHKRTIRKKRVRAQKLFPMPMLLQHFDGKCYHCGITVEWIKGIHLLAPNAATRDHMIPLSIGGTNAKDNVVLSCRHCNSKKGNIPDMSRVGWVSSNNLRKRLSAELDIMEEWYLLKKRQNNPDYPKRRAKSRTFLWLAGTMGLSYEEARITQMNRTQVEQALELCREYRERKGF